MFKFNFQVENDESTDLTNSTKEDQPNQDLTEELTCYGAEKVDPEEKHLQILDVYRASSTTLTVGSLELSYLLGGCLRNILSETGEDIAKAEVSHTDLIPGVYEGGAKVWECTEDLLGYMSEHYKDDYLKEKHVLDLGCGAGLLGIYALKQNATTEFQDYNKDVLQNITIPNIILNHSDETNVQDDLKKITFYSGDWSNYTTLTKEADKFDLILTSETIYNQINYKKLVDTFKMKLKKDGIVLLAAKIYYFGVGGGLRIFEEFLKNDGVFSSRVVWKSTSDVTREILEIKFADTSL